MTVSVEHGHELGPTVAKYRGQIWVEYETSGGSPLVTINDATVDSRVGLQTIIDGANDGDQISFPRDARVGIGSIGAGNNNGIEITGRQGLQLVSSCRPVNGSPAPQFTWLGNDGGYMFLLNGCNTPAVKGFKFGCASGKSCNTYLEFDGNTGSTPTLAEVMHNMFSSPSSNANWAAVAVSRTSTNNHENYKICDNYILGSGTTTTASQTGATNGTTALSCVTMLNSVDFTANVGKRIRISYAGGMHDTTIASASSASACTLAAATSFSQSNCTVHVGERYGTGILLGPSYNSKHHRLWENNIQNCAIGVDVQNGSFDIMVLEGGFNDISLRIGYLTEPSRVHMLGTEGDMCHVQFDLNANIPVHISNARIQNSDQRADGYYRSTGDVTIAMTNACLETTGIQSNATLFNTGVNWRGISRNNMFAQPNALNSGISYAESGLASFASLDSIDTFSGSVLAHTVIGLPTADPHVVGRKWLNAGVETISAG